MNKLYWNPYAGTRAHYESTYKEAASWVAKRVKVTDKDGRIISGVVSRISTCANGGIGLLVYSDGVDQWVGPEFTNIKEV